MNALKQLQELLRDLFQLDMADLDFGLYRLFYLKRHEMEAFLTEQLPRRVNEAFQSMAGQEFVDMERELSELREKLRENLGEDALLENGEINPEYRKEKSKITRKLMEAYETNRVRIQSIKVTEAQQAEVFNHLYAFFSRYYDEGDFIPRRFFGARAAYAVPYNGEEVLFHEESLQVLERLLSSLPKVQGIESSQVYKEANDLYREIKKEIETKETVH